MALCFSTLHFANMLRLPHFKNCHGELSHPGGIDDWSPNDWMTAVTGELGEAANVLKKYRRGDIGYADMQALTAGELADVAIYLDLLAERIGVNLEHAVREKFNIVSRRVGAPVFINVNQVQSGDPDADVGPGPTYPRCNSNPRYNCPDCGGSAP